MVKKFKCKDNVIQSKKLGETTILHKKVILKKCFEPEKRRFWRKRILENIERRE